MSALLKIESAGFSVSLADSFIEITPANNLTDSHRNYLKSHKEEIIIELQERQPTNTNDANTSIIKCYDCQHFISLNHHGKGSGSCESVDLFGYFQWSEASHECLEFGVKQ